MNNARELQASVLSTIAVYVMLLLDEGTEPVTRGESAGKARTLAASLACWPIVKYFTDKRNKACNVCCPRPKTSLSGWIARSDGRVSVMASTSMNVFISHAEEDTAQASALARTLFDAGIRSFSYVFNPAWPGTDFTQQITAAIEHAHVIALLWGLDAAESSWVQREIAYASQCKKTDNPGSSIRVTGLTADPY